MHSPKVHKSDTLELTMWDFHHSGHQAFLGEVLLTEDDFTVTKKAWFVLQGRDTKEFKNHKVEGEIELLIERS